jgi:hypothetical protein
MGYIITYAGCPMHWASKMQTEIALSATEAEYKTCIMHNPYGNLSVSTWFLLYGYMLTHGILLEWSKYLNKISKERYFR